MKKGNPKTTKGMRTELTEPSRKLLGNRLRDARTRSGLNMTTAARSIGATRATLSHMEGGSCTTRLPFVVALAVLYGVTLDSLLHGVEVIKPLHRTPSAARTVYLAAGGRTPVPAHAPREGGGSA